MRTLAKGIRVSPEEFELIQKACAKVGATFADFVRASAVSAAAFVLAEEDKAILNRLAQKGVIYLGVAAIYFKDGKGHFLFHAPVELGQMTQDLLKKKRASAQPFSCQPIEATP